MRNGGSRRGSAKSAAALTGGVLRSFPWLRARQILQGVSTNSARVPELAGSDQIFRRVVVLQLLWAGDQDPPSGVLGRERVGPGRRVSCLVDVHVQELLALPAGRQASTPFLVESCEGGNGVGMCTRESAAAVSLQTGVAAP